MHPEVIRNFPEMSATDSVLNNVLNSDEHNESEDSEEFGNETIDHKSVNDLDVEIICSTYSTESWRSSCSSKEHEGDHEITKTILGATQPQTNSLLSSLKAPKASSLSYCNYKYYALVVN